MKHVFLITCATLALTGCGSSKAEPHEKVVDITDTRNMQGSAASEDAVGQVRENPKTDAVQSEKTENEPTEIAANSRPIDRRAVGRYLANKWRIDGYAQCGFHMIVMTAQAARSNDMATFNNMKELVDVMGEAKPFLDPTPDASLSSAALTQYRAFHENDPVSVQAARLKQCLLDIGEAMEASRS
jgi:hypothetical protein